MVFGYRHCIKLLSLIRSGPNKPFYILIYNRDLQYVFIYSVFLMCDVTDVK